MERLVKGIWIPIEIWQNSSLSWNEKILLMEIDSFTSKNMDCFMSNEYIANLLGVSDRSARSYLSNLIEQGYVKVVKFDGRTRFLKSNLSYCQAEWKESSMQTGWNLPHNNKEEQINIDINTLSYKRGRFEKPSLDEIKEYCQQRGNNISPESFFSFYESNGWMVGKNKMKDWKAAVRTWEQRRKEEKNTTPPKKESVFEKNLKAMDQMFGTNYHAQAYKNTPDYDEQ